MLHHPRRPQRTPSAEIAEDYATRELRSLSGAPITSHRASSSAGALLPAAADRLLRRRGCGGVQRIRLPCAVSSVVLPEAPPHQSTISRMRRFDRSRNAQAAFSWILRSDRPMRAWSWGGSWALTAQGLEANAAPRSIVRHRRELFLTKLARASVHRDAHMGRLRAYRSRTEGEGLERLDAAPVRTRREEREDEGRPERTRRRKTAHTVDLETRGDCLGHCARHRRVGRRRASRRQPAPVQRPDRSRSHDDIAHRRE